MNKRSRITKGFSHRLIAVLLCCVCLLAATPVYAIASEADLAPAVEETVAENPVETPAEPEAPETPEVPASEESGESAAPAKETSDELFARLMAYETLDELNTALNALTEEEQALLDQFTDEQNAALEAKTRALGGYDADVLADRTCSFTQGQSGTEDISVSGTLKKSNFSSDCAQNGIAAVWKDSNSYTITVGASVPAGIYTLTVKYETTSYNWWGQATTTENTDTVTIMVTEAGTEYAQVFYLKTPTSDPDSNATSEWGRNIGNGTVKTAGATWTKDSSGVDKNIFSPGAYVTGMPTGMVKQADGSWLLPKNSTYSQDYTAIYNAYRTQLEKELGVTLLESDIEAIYLTPYKISQNNSSTPDKHIDCKISVKAKNVFAAVFWVTLPDGTQKQVDAKNYVTGSQVEKTTKAPTGTSNPYPETMTVDGVTYKFDGWYNEANEKILEDSWAYTPNEAELADGTVNFYARYVQEDAKLTIKKTLSGNMYDEDASFRFTVTYGGEEKEIWLGKDEESEPISIPVGAVVTITEEARDYTYSLTSVTPDDFNYTKLANGVSFMMPESDVTVEINNEKNIIVDTGIMLDTLPYVLILAAVGFGGAALVKKRRCRGED